MQCNLRTLFTRPPCSEAELFRKVKQCVSIFEPERLQNLSLRRKKIFKHWNK